MPVLKNSRNELFALAVARGETADSAYRLAGYKPHRQNAARLRTNDDIQRRIVEVQKLAETATVLNIRQKREFIARVVRARLAELPDSSDLWQEIRFSEGGTTRKLPDKLRAIALDNILSAEVSEANREEVTVVVRIGGDDIGEPDA
jgi:hypothetical protein